MMKNSKPICVAYQLDYWQNVKQKKPIILEFGTGENSHVLITGMSGSGKSYCELQLMAKIVKCDVNSEVYFSDYKGDDSFKFLRNCDRYYFFHDTLKALDIVYEKLQNRMSGKDESRHQITLVWDEYVANILALQSEDSKLAKKVMNQVSTLLLLGRSLGLRLLCASQRPDAVVFPAGARQNYGLVIILGAPMRSTYEMLLPSREYIEKVENRRFSRGEGVMLVQGVDEYVIKVPTIRNQEKVQQLCIDGLNEKKKVSKEI